MTKKTKKQYFYDFPEQRELSKGLRYGDMEAIANKTGYKRNTISEMCSGRRKMNDKVKSVIKQIIEHNKQFEKITA